MEPPSSLLPLPLHSIGFGNSLSRKTLDAVFPGLFFQIPITRQKAVSNTIPPWNHRKKITSNDSWRGHNFTFWSPSRVQRTVHTNNKILHIFSYMYQACRFPLMTGAGRSVEARKNFAWESQYLMSAAWTNVDTLPLTSLLWPISHNSVFAGSSSTQSESTKKSSVSQE